MKDEYQIIIEIIYKQAMFDFVISFFIVTPLLFRLFKLTINFIQNM
jgi:hypothetical protein